MKEEIIYEKVCRRLFIEGDSCASKTDFTAICAEVGVGLVKANNILYRRLGMSGDDILMAFRNGKADVPH